MEECSKAEHSSNHLNNWGFPNFANTGDILNTLHLGMVYSINRLELKPEWQTETGPTSHFFRKPGGWTPGGMYHKHSDDKYPIEP